MAAGVLAFGVGIATSDKANGKPTPGTQSVTPLAQLGAPASTGVVAPAPGPANPPAPPAEASAPPGPPQNAPPPVPAPANAGPPAPGQAPQQAPPPTAAPQRPVPTPTPMAVPRAGAPVPPPPPAPAPSLGAVDLTPLEQKLYVLQNAFRNGQQLPSLQLDPRLVAIARMRAHDMVTHNYFAHTSPTGVTAFALLSQAGYIYTIAGENIARNNYPEAEAANIAMDGFLNSASHKENVLDGRFKNVGIGVAVAPDGMKYFAVIFAS